MLKIYQKITVKCGALFDKILELRLKANKEDPKRISERQGNPTLPRPDGTLIWIHAASVGEAQSTLILIKSITDIKPDAQFMITSGTVTSAKLMAERLPDNAFHQYYPLDRPDWVNSFIEHWKPDMILWMESELWPNMLGAIKAAKIPALLVNARLSNKSYNAWNLCSGMAKELLSTFEIILCQTTQDQARFEKLGAPKAVTTDNVKFSAAPLPISNTNLEKMQTAIADRPTWVFASTHDGEEQLACRIHQTLKQKVPNLLTIIVPRHPERRDDIMATCKTMKVHATLRTDDKNLPTSETEIYVADTLGELGLFYTLSQIAVIGRSFSNDGGGGHNPIEAAQMKCAVLTGPNVQYQQQLFNEMFAVNAAYQLDDKTELLQALRTLFDDEQMRHDAIARAEKFAGKKTGVIKTVMENITPVLNRISTR